MYETKIKQQHVGTYTVDEVCDANDHRFHNKYLFVDQNQTVYRRTHLRGKYGQPLHITVLDCISSGRSNVVISSGEASHLRLSEFVGELIITANGD